MSEQNIVLWNNDSKAVGWRLYCMFATLSFVNTLVPNNIPLIILQRKRWFDMWQLSNTLTSVHSEAVTCGNDNKIVYMCIKYHPSLPNDPFQSKIAHNTLLILINDNSAKQEYISTLQNCVTSSAEVTIFQISHLQSAFGLQPEIVTGTSFVCEGSRPKSFFAPIPIAGPKYPIQPMLFCPHW